MGRKLSPAGLIHRHSQQQLALQEVTPELEPDPARSQVPEITYPGESRRTSAPACSSERAWGGARTPSHVQSCWGTSPQENGSAFWHKTSPCRVHPHVLKQQKGRKTTKKPQTRTKQTEKSPLGCYSEWSGSFRIKSACWNTRRDKLLVYFNHITCFVPDPLLTARH